MSQDTVTQSYIDAFAGGKDHLPGSGVSWLDNLRRQAIDSFAGTGFPTPQMEEWKFTNLRPLTRRPFQPTASDAGTRTPGPRAAPDIAPYVVRETAPRLVFVGGRLDRDLSSLPSLPTGVTLTSMGEILAKAPERLKPLFENPPEGAASSLAALNTALAADGAVLIVDEGVRLTTPVEILYLGGEDGSACFTRTLVQVQAGAEASMIETYAGLGAAGDYWANALTRIEIAAGGRLTHYRIQDDSRQGFHVGYGETRIGTGARYDRTALSIGGRLARDEAIATFAGEKARLSLNGIYVGHGDQHLDNTTVIDHRHPNCQSSEHYKSVLDDKAHGVFQGKIIVSPHAQRTDARQLSQNLLLSEEAHADAKPELQIYADDVKCAHGATVGELDEDALFYLQSRGIDEGEARALLISGYVRELVEILEDEAVAAHMTSLLEKILILENKGEDKHDLS